MGRKPLKEIEDVEFIVRDLEADNYNKTFIQSLKTVLQTLKRYINGGIFSVKQMKYITKNYISKKEIEDKIEELKNYKMDIVQSPVHNVNEKMKMLDKNMIKREVLQELLEEK